MEIVKIEDSFVKSDRYPTVSERYFKCFFYQSDDATSPDHCILLHSNKICVITLAPSHPILVERKKVIHMDFQVSNKVDRRENRVIGKAKKGGQFIRPDSLLCLAECQDGSKYPIYGCVSGKLIEVNERLSENYNLIVDKPTSDGYIAIILPSRKGFNPMRDLYKKMEC